MFKELSPLLTKRNLVLTLASVGDARIRVTITPRATGKDEPKELAQPFAVEGTAEELDAELPQSIVSYTAEHLSLARSLEQVKTNMEAALKEAKDEAAKKVAEAKNGSKAPATKPAVAEAKIEAERPTTPSLFDAPSETAPTFRASVAAGAAGDGAAEEGDVEAPSKPLAPAAGNPVPETAAQQSIFSRSSEEDEILQEAFYGTQDNHIAA